MNNISSGTIARTIVLALALINQVLTFFNINPIPISDDEIYSIVTTLFTIGAAVWAWWKNNSFTQNAIAADDYKEVLNKEEK